MPAQFTSISMRLSLLITEFDASVIFYDAGTTSNVYIGKSVTVPAKTTLIVVGKDSPIYLEESDKITAFASAASDGNIIVSYEELDDA